MAKKSRMGAPKKKRGQAPLEIRVKVGRRKEPTIEDVEKAIKKALASRPTDLFRNRKKVIITVEDEGN